MAKPAFHIFVCVQHRAEGHPRGSCGAKGANQLLDAFGQALIRNNLIGKVALNGSSCLGPCQAGANVLIYPGAVMYSWITPEDVDALIRSHIVEGTPWPEKLTPAEIW